MNRQFLRIYLGIALVLLLGVTGFLVLSQQWLKTVRRADFDDRTNELLQTIRDELAAAGPNSQDRYLVLNMFSLTHNLPIRLMPSLMAPLTSAEKKQLRAGAVLTIEDGGMFQTYAETVDGEIIIVGPYIVGEMMQWQETLVGDNVPRATAHWATPGFLGKTDLFYLMVMAGSFLCLGAVIYFLIRPLERRIYALSDVAQAFGQGHLDRRAPAEQQDAVAQLARSFNEMADRIGGLVEGQREMMRVVSHELRTPLARSFFLIENLKHTEDPDDRLRCVGRIQHSLAELNDLVEELLQFIRLDGAVQDADFEVVDLCDEIDHVREAAIDLREDLRVHVACNAQSMVACRRYLRRALTNLVTNAVHHATRCIWIRCDETDRGIALCVEDDGPGIPEDLWKKIFEPFFRTDESQKAKIRGTGLGLAIVQRIVKLHGGTVEVCERPGGGARFLMWFPTL